MPVSAIDAGMSRIAKRYLRAAILGLMMSSASLVGCTETPQAATGAPTNGKRLFYVGLALYSEHWSENDVVELAGELRDASKFFVVPMIASNVTSDRGIYPIADDAAIASLIRSAAAQAGPDDVIFVDISTHGAPRALASKVGDGPLTELTSRELARKLAPLAGHRSVIVISACFSGSLIADLRAPDRIIITAARADRTSFGCAPDSRHTFFGDAELRAFAQPDHSLHQVFGNIRDDVAGMERAKRYTPSEPQVSVGAGVSDLYETPAF
jgi:hypothetical protein